MTTPITYPRTDVRQGDHPVIEFDFTPYFPAAAILVGAITISPSGQVTSGELTIAGLLIKAPIDLSEAEANREYLLEMSATDNAGTVRSLAQILVILPQAEVIAVPPIAAAAEARAFRAFLTEDEENNLSVDIVNTDAANYLGTPAWTYNDIGEWNAFKEGAFPENKCIDIGRPLEGGYQLTGKRVDDDNFLLKITDANGMGVDGQLVGTYVELVVFK